MTVCPTETDLVRYRLLSEAAISHALGRRKASYCELESFGRAALAASPSRITSISPS